MTFFGDGVVLVVGIGVSDKDKFHGCSFLYALKYSKSVGKINSDYDIIVLVIPNECEESCLGNFLLNYTLPRPAKRYSLNGSAPGKLIANYD
jgi:hypothetical protein